MEELIRLGVAMGMALRVKIYLGLELFVADLGGDHSDDLTALALGDGVERGIDLAVVDDRLMD